MTKTGMLKEADDLGNQVQEIYSKALDEVNTLILHTDRESRYEFFANIHLQAEITAVDINNREKGRVYVVTGDDPSGLDAINFGMRLLRDVMGKIAPKGSEISRATSIDLMRVFSDSGYNKKKIRATANKLSDLVDLLRLTADLGDEDSGSLSGIDNALQQMLDQARANSRQNKPSES